MENSATIDRISDLPDEVLCHILSFLPIKLAFVTSVLSKRWTPLCNLLTALRFNDKSVRDKESFLRFCLLVESLTVSPHVPQPPVKTFHLKCSSGYWYNGSLKINKWVEAAKLRRVEDLNISFMNDQWYWYNRITLDPNTFKCPTLVVLKLSKLRVVGEKKFSAYLPSLKTLYLENVTLQNSEDLKTLLSNCPILEDLHTEMYYLDGGGGRPVGFKTLSKLVRADICLFDVPFRAIYNVEFLRLVKIKETLYDAELNSYYKDLPVFRNLIHLELKFYDFRHGWDDVVGMLQHCPKLQILLIKKVWKHEFKSNLYTNWKYPNYVPECVSSHLRSCTITSSCGLEDELRFATHILQNARLLQVMTINSSESLNSMQKHQFLDELSSCPKISPECKVSLTISRYPFF